MSGNSIKKMGAAVLSGVLIMLLYCPVSPVFSSGHIFLSFTGLRAQAEENGNLNSGSSVSDNSFSETQVDTSAGDVMDDTGHVTNSSEAEAQKQEEVQSNLISGWPQGPSITAGSAILIDADTGTILYSKNIHQKMYPASTTKMLTCLIAAENLDLNDTVTFSQSAIDAVPADGSNIGMSVGETITVEQALYGLMVGSANECANALAEKVSGSIDSFVDLMNQTAAELGCTDSHFVNTNGLYDENHYTSACDLALIAVAFFNNDICRTIGNCATYHFEATATQPDDFTLTNKHQLITGETSYSGIIGGKTGYTSQSHENLVTGCIQNDTELIAVVMREDAPAQFNDTVSLFDYGYGHFSKISVQEHAALPAEDVGRFMTTGTDLLGSSVPALTIAAGGYVDLPDTVSFSDLTADYGSDNSITYYFGNKDEDVIVGSAALAPADHADSVSDTVSQADSSSSYTYNDRQSEPSVPVRILTQYIMTSLNGTIYINVSAFLVTMIAVYIILSVCFRFRASMQETRERARARRKRARRAHAERNDYYENHRYDRPDHFYSPDSYNGDYYDNGFSSSYTGSNNYRDDYYGNESYDDYYDDHY